MARRLFFVEGVRRGTAELRGESAYHLTRVLRVEAGERYEISDNSSLYLAEVEAARKDLVSFRVIEELPVAPAPVRLVLYPALIKFERFEWMLEKATELGVEAVIPVETDRSEKGLERAAGKRLERWRKIVVESSQQSRRVQTPRVEEGIRFGEALAGPATHRYFLDEDRNAQPALRVLPEAGLRLPSDTIALLAGPEGGWTDSERRRAIEAGWKPVSLGRQILRTETAAIAALSVLGNAWLAAGTEP